MSEEHNADEAAEDKKSSKSVNRRRFVKSLGVAGGAAAFGTLGSVPASAKSGDTSDMDMGRVPDATANKSVGTARSSSEFRVLREYLIENYDQATETDTAQVVEARPENDAPARIVSFKTDYTGPANEAPNLRGNVAITLQSGSVARASAVLQYLEDGKPVRVTEFNVTNGTVEKQSEEIPDPNSKSPTGDAPTIQPSRTIPDAAECEACKIVAQAACSFGCTFGVGALCALAVVGGGLPGGIGCAAMASTVCTAIERQKNACAGTAESLCTATSHCNDDDPFI